MWYNADMLQKAGIDTSTTSAWTYGDSGTALVNWQKLTVDANGDGTPEVFGLEHYGPWDYFQRIPSRSNGEEVMQPIMVSRKTEYPLPLTGYFDSDVCH